MSRGPGMVQRRVAEIIATETAPHMSVFGLRRGLDAVDIACRVYGRTGTVTDDQYRAVLRVLRQMLRAARVDRYTDDVSRRHMWHRTWTDAEREQILRRYAREPSDVERAYRTLAQVLHPDKGGSDEAMAALNVLRRATRR